MPVSPRTVFPLHAVYNGFVLGPLGFIAYIEDLSVVSERHNVYSHMYADDTQLYDSSTLADAESVRDRLIRYVSDVAKWCASRRLQLNPDKTETIWFGSCSYLAKLQRINQSLQVGTSKVVRDLGVYLDSELTINNISPKLLLPASTTFVICVRSVVESARKLHSYWSWLSSRPD